MPQPNPTATDYAARARELVHRYCDLRTDAYSSPGMSVALERQEIALDLALRHARAEGAVETLKYQRHLTHPAFRNAWQNDWDRSMESLRAIEEEIDAYS